MFKFFQRKSAKNPSTIEWQCGSFRHRNILDALEHATDAQITLIRNGRAEGARDCTTELHEFTCRCVEDLLRNAKMMQLPVYQETSVCSIDAGTIESELPKLLLQLAQKHADGQANTSLQRIAFAFPESFFAALGCK